MSVIHYLLVLLLVCIWGFNFVVIKVGLEEIPPLFLACIRFFLTSFPAIFFLKKPKTQFSRIVYYGLVMFMAQFSLFFIGMHLGVSPGIASILLQIHVFFSLFLAIFLFREKITWLQISGALISFAGIGYVGMNLEGSVSLLGFFLVVVAALLWGAGSAIAKTFGKVNMLSLVVWGSMVAWPPLLLLSLLVEGPELIVHGLTHISWTSAAAILYLAYLSTLFGFGLWNWLIHHQPLSRVAPFTLLVPVVAMFCSAVFLEETIEMWKIIGACLVLGGLSINTLGPRLFKKRRKKSMQDDLMV